MKNSTLASAVLLLLCASIPVFGQSSIEGEWSVTRGVMAGDPVPAEALANMKLNISGQTFDAQSGSRTSSGTIAEQGRKGQQTLVVFKINSGDDSGREVKAAFQKVGANLKIFFSQNDDFPMGITSTNENQLLMLTYSNSNPATASRGRSGRRKLPSMGQPELAK